MHSPPLDAAELRLYCADGHDPDTYTSIYTAMRFSSDAPRSPALWALRTLLTGEAKPALDRRRVAAPSSTQPASPPSERRQTSAAHTRRPPHRPQRPRPVPARLRGSQEEGRGWSCRGRSDEPGAELE